jgi:pyruvate formate-lyase activating enzyme-like uncharacterized protein
MKVKATVGESLAAGKLPRGCQLCIKGRKLVLFVTGKCNLDCYYCTISKGRWQADEVWANERLVLSGKDIIDEAKKCGAKGAGITGGEPLLELDRVVSYIRLLKKKFGKQFHIHLYTNGTLATAEVLRKLHAAGLDELRIHQNKEAVKEALKLEGWKVGMEVPCIPGKEKELCDLVDLLEKVGAHFLNLNELEFSERNIAPMEKIGLAARKDSLTAVKGSRETAVKFLRYAESKQLPVHFCTAALKLDYQLRNRLRNRAKNIRKGFEKVTPEGFLLKGVVMADDLKKVVNSLRKFGLKDGQFALKTDKRRIELSASDARKLAKKMPFKFAVVKEYPCAEPWDWELTPLNYRPEVS